MVDGRHFSVAVGVSDVSGVVVLTGGGSCGNVAVVEGRHFDRAVAVSGGVSVGL